MRTARAFGGAVAGVVLVAVAWPALGARDEISADIHVRGNGALNTASDEVARRLRQAGFVPDVQSIDAAACADSQPTGDLVISLDDWTGCVPPVGALLVEQPGGQRVPAELARRARVRSSEPLFSANRPEAACESWDTPGPGEDRPGLGQCRSGRVTLIEDGVLTPAGRERFARLIVGAVG